MSDYSQRLSKAAGKVADEYLYSAEIDSLAFAEIGFSALADVDPLESLTGFRLRRKMTKAGVFKVIEPFAEYGAIALRQEREAE